MQIGFICNLLGTGSNYETKREKKGKENIEKINNENGDRKLRIKEDI